MLTCTRKFEFEAAHRLYEYDGLCANIHGHSYVAEVTIANVGAVKVNELGILLDFHDVKEIVGHLIDARWDHALLLNKDDPLLQEPCLSDQRVCSCFGNPTAENMADWLSCELNAKFLSLELPFKVVKVVIWETRNCCATVER